MFNEREVVLDFVRTDGPVLPIQVARKINSNTMFAGAILSELIANKLIRISYAKIGGSPVYYAAGQEEKLGILYEHLHGREKEAYNLLKNNKILLDEEQEPSIRFALSQIRDFAFSFYLNKDNREIKVWRWYLINEEEAVRLFNNLFKKEEKIEEKQIETIKEIAGEDNITLIKEKEAKPKKIKQEIKSKFFDSVYNYFEKNKVRILENEIIRKGKEIDFICKVTSSLGDLNYLIKATDKKSLNEKDIIFAYNKGSLRKLPVILLGKGRLSKKAEKYINENLKGYLLFRNIE